MFTTEEGNLMTSSSVVCFANARKYSEEILGRLTFEVFYTIVFHGVILSLVLDKVFL